MKAVNSILQAEEINRLKQENENFRSEFEDDIKEGSNLTFEDCAQNKAKIEIRGNTFQQSYTGSNLLNRTTCDENKDYIWANGNLIDKTGSITSDYISVNNLTNIASNYYFFIAFYNSSKSYLGNDTDLRTTGGTARKTINISNIVSNYSSIAYFKLCFKSSNNNSTDMTTVDIMLNTGTTALDYEPYTNGPSPNPDYSQDIQVVTGENNILVNNGNLGNMNTLYQEMYAFNPSYVSQDTIDNKKCIVFNNNRFRSNDGFRGLQGRYKKNTQYKLNTDLRIYDTSFTSGCSLSTYFFYVDGTSKRVNTPANGSNWNSIELISDVNKTVDYIAFSYGDNAKWCLANLSITEYVESQTYEYKESQEQNYPISLGSIELCKIGDYQDYIYKSGDNWYEHKEVAKVFLKDLTYEIASQQPDDNNLILFICKSITNRAYSENLNPLCNYLSYRGSVSGLSSAKNLGVGFCFLYSQSENKYIYFIIEKSKASTIAELINWANNNNVALYYELETPTDTQIIDTTLINQLNELEKAHSYYGQTIILALCDSANVPIELKGVVKKSNRIRIEKLEEAILN